MKRTLFCILFALSFCYKLMAASGVYDVRDFGAKGNGIALDHVAINKAIEAATAGGGGHTYFHNSLIWADGQQNVSITGHGMIDGEGLTKRDTEKAGNVQGGSIGTGDKAIALKLQNAGKDVNYLLTWNRPHSGDYALDELFQWIRDIME